LNLFQKFAEQAKEPLSLVIFTKALKFYNIHSYEALSMIFFFFFSFFLSFFRLAFECFL